MRRIETRQIAELGRRVKSERLLGSLHCHPAGKKSAFCRLFRMGFVQIDGRLVSLLRWRI